MLIICYYFFQVIDTNGHVLYKKDDATKGKFAFTTDDYDMFEVCFQSEGNLIPLICFNDCLLSDKYFIEYVCLDRVAQRNILGLMCLLIIYSLKN